MLCQDKQRRACSLIDTSYLVNCQHKPFNILAMQLQASSFKAYLTPPSLCRRRDLFISFLTPIPPPSLFGARINGCLFNLSGRLATIGSPFTAHPVDITTEHLKSISQKKTLSACYSASHGGSNSELLRVYTIRALWPTPTMLAGLR